MYARLGVGVLAAPTVTVQVPTFRPDLSRMSCRVGVSDLDDVAAVGGLELAARLRGVPGASGTPLAPFMGPRDSSRAGSWHRGATKGPDQFLLVMT